MREKKVKERVDEGQKTQKYTLKEGRTSGFKGTTRKRRKDSRERNPTPPPTCVELQKKLF